MKEYDAFISHASEDKRYFVRDLAQKLSDFGAKIWYDEFSLRAGLSLSHSIEKGIANSNYGIVILSKNFFNKKWGKYELSALNSLEVENPGIIIPVWYKVTSTEVRTFSPYLGDKLAILTEGRNIEDVALDLLKVIKEDLFEDIHKKKAWNMMIRKTESKKMSTEEIKKVLKFGPIRHSSLPLDLITRIRLIRAVLLQVYPHSFEFWLEGFLRDLHPEDEVQIWERIASCFLEAIGVIHANDKIEQKEIFNIILGISLGANIKDIKIEKLKQDEINKILNIWKNIKPFFDFKDEKFGNKID